MQNKNFVFYLEYNLPVLLGMKAANVYELLEGLRVIPDSSLYYHTHKFLIQHHYLIPEPPNDFAYWLRNILIQPHLGEMIASINIASCNSLGQLREKMIEIIENHDRTGYGVNCHEGFEFRFMSCKTFRFRYNDEASNLGEFYDILKKIDISTFYVNVFSPLLRQGKKRNNFAEWFAQIGEEALAEKVSSLDPYTMTLEGLRQRILNIIKNHGQYR
ncbi:MAG: DUF5752 family protein [Bacteroidetes bacterium]|nr:DUF5752 family protein [Bacteroidota bacterium]